MGSVMCRCSARRAVTKSKFLSLALLSVIAASCASLGTAVAADAVTNTLSVSRVMRQADGTEHRESASNAKPGDVLEYEAIYRNSGSGAVHKLLATIPIPGGATYVMGSPLPNTATASLDGINFARIPLKRQVQQANGAMLEQPVAAAEYRFVRWTVDELAPGAIVTVAVRVSVSTDAVPAAASSSAVAASRAAKLQP
jgi:uncharacterized repeat protein (TIGR01451 family)